MRELENQVVLITGANGALGTHTTEAFLEAGATVVGTSRSTPNAPTPNPCFVGIAADLTDAEAARMLADGVMQRFQRIDVLVHVMGGFAGGSPIHQLDDSTWDSMMNVNLRAGFHILREVIPLMRAAGRGRIIAIGSRQAIEPQPNIAAYSASKAALLSLVRTAALENKDAGITANVILPGTLDTEANREADPAADSSKWISPARIAALAVFLASEAGAQISGAAIPVYGKAV